MPSPIGHALAGTAVACAGDALDRRRSTVRFILTCVVLAAIPDIDLLVPRWHRTATHSVTAVVVVFIVAAGVTGWVNRRRAGLKPCTTGEKPCARTEATWRVATVCAAAWASHLLLDWLGVDTLRPLGIQVFWPFDSRFFVSGLGLFAETERRHAFSGPTLYQNLRAAAQEIAILAPVALALWRVRIKALAGFAAKMSSRDEPT